MPYCTQADLVNRFGEDELIQLTDQETPGEINPVPVAAAIADTDAEIDGYLGSRYTLPLSSVPALVQRLACDIARYRLHDDREVAVVRQHYEDSVDILKRIAGGSITLFADSAAAPATAQTATPGSRVSVFTDAVLAKMP